VAGEINRKQEQYKVKCIINLQSTQNVGEIEDEYHMASYSFLFLFNSSPSYLTHS